MLILNTFMHVASNHSTQFLFYYDYYVMKTNLFNLTKTKKYYFCTKRFIYSQVYFFIV